MEDFVGKLKANNNPGKFIKRIKKLHKGFNIFFLKTLLFRKDKKII